MRLTSENLWQEVVSNANRPARLALDILRLHPPTMLVDKLNVLRPSEWQELVAFARLQKISSMIYGKLRKWGVLESMPQDLLQELHESYLGNMARNLSLYHDLKLICSWLRDAGIPVIVLKGAYLAREVYNNIAMRQMFDLDLLVPHSELLRAYDVITGHGYYPNPDDHKGAEERIKSHHHLIGLKKGSSHMVELHWHIEVPEHWPIEEFWERAVPFGLEDLKALCFSPEDLLLHLCHHLSYQHRFGLGLRPVLDICSVIDHFGETLDWKVIGERAERLGWSKGVLLALTVTQLLLGCEFPDSCIKITAEDRDLHEQQAAAISLLVNENSWCMVPPNLALLWEEAGAMAKLGILTKRIFIPPQQLASQYDLDPRSLTRYWYYLVRIKDLLVQNRWVVGQRDDLQFLIRQNDNLNIWLGRKN
jgi:hypothetical protein